MSPVPHLINLAVISAVLAVLWSTCSAATSSADLARCAAIAAPDVRLNCYDTLAGRPPDRSPAATAPSVAGAQAVAAAASATPHSIAPAASATAPTPALQPDDPRNFGLAAPQPQPTRVGPAAIQAHIKRIFESRLGIGRPSIVLDNGQTWTFAETNDDPRLGPGDAITIKRAALGSFVMTTPSHHTYHIHRTQ
ncbi:MAG: hypothetical protein ABJD53_05525 [Gammaproteobacteria bacterium]